MFLFLIRRSLPFISVTVFFLKPRVQVARGPDFGVEGIQGEDIKGRDSFLDCLHSHGKRCALLDQSETLVKVIRGEAAAIVCRSNEEVAAKLKAQVRLVTGRRDNHRDATPRGRLLRGDLSAGPGEPGGDMT